MVKVYHEWSSAVGVGEKFHIKKKREDPVLKKMTIAAVTLDICKVKWCMRLHISHRVGQGFWVYGIQGFLNRVYGILQPKYGYSVYHFL